MYQCNDGHGFDNGFFGFLLHGGPKVVVDGKVTHRQNKIKDMKQMRYSLNRSLVSLGTPKCTLCIHSILFPTLYMKVVLISPTSILESIHTTTLLVKSSTKGSVYKVLLIIILCISSLISLSRIAFYTN